MAIFLASWSETHQTILPVMTAMPSIYFSHQSEPIKSIQPKSHLEECLVPVRTWMQLQIVPEYDRNAATARQT